MIVAIKPTLKNNNYIYNTIQTIANQYPQHQFIFLISKDLKAPNFLENNIRIIPISTTPKIAFFKSIWIKRIINQLLLNNIVDVFINLNTIYNIPPNIKQYVIVENVELLKVKKNDSFLVNKWGVHYAAIQEKLVTTFSILKNQIHVLPQAINPLIKALDDEIKEKIKDEFANGKEYFLYLGNFKDTVVLINILKAFSLFKKRQMSNMQLLFVNQLGIKNITFENELLTYKYKEDVKIFNEVTKQTFTQILASAYVLICTNFNDELENTVLQGMKCGVPIINLNSLNRTDLFLNATISITPTDILAIANALMLLFKDEKERDNLITKGNKIAETYTEINAAKALWNMIQ